MHVNDYKKLQCVVFSECTVCLAAHVALLHTEHSEVSLNIQMCHSDIFQSIHCSLQDRVEGESASTTVLKWIPKCLTGLTLDSGKDTPGERYENY